MRSRLALWYSPKKPHNLLDKPLVIDWTCSEDEENLDVADGKTKVLVYKQAIKYMYKVGDQG